MEIFIAIISLVALDIAALLRGADSRDDVNSEEWRRRAVWPVA